MVEGARSRVNKPKRNNFKLASPKTETRPTLATASSIHHAEMDVSIERQKHKTTSLVKRCDSFACLRHKTNKQTNYTLVYAQEDILTVVVVVDAAATTGGNNHNDPLSAVLYSARYLTN